MKKLILPLRWVAILPASLLTTIIVYYLFTGFISLLALFAPMGSYGDVISIVAIGMAAYFFMVVAVLIAPKFKIAVATVVLVIALMFVAFQIGKLVERDNFVFLYQMQFLVAVSATIAAYVKTVKAKELSFDTFFNS